MVLRGYDRVEVDQYITELLQENSTLRRELDARAASAAAGAPAGAPAVADVPTVDAQDERAQASPYYDVETPAEDSFGFRAEKLLRLAERDAAEMRTRATRDAETVEATSRRRAEEQLRAAEKEADDLRAQAAQESARLKKQASQEAARLSHLHTSTKGELRRLAEMLNAELDRPDPDGTAPVDESDVPPGQNAGTWASNR
jgi:cell division septum initiation protein DivIVA